MDLKLTKNEIAVIHGLIGHPSWPAIRAKLMLDCPRGVTSGLSVEESLIRKAIGFEYWTLCIERLESYASIKKEPRPEKEETLEQ